MFYLQIILIISLFRIIYSMHIKVLKKIENILSCLQLSIVREAYSFNLKTLEQITLSYMTNEITNCH